MRKLSMQMIYVALGLLCVVTSVSFAQEDYDKVQIETVPVDEGIAMLMGSGGNLGVSFGEDGVFLIDDQFAPLTEKITAAIGALSDKPVRFVFNTHWHFDHVGGNENLGKAGAVIVAHENVRKRMSVGQMMKAFNMEVPAAPKVALPVITFTQDVTFHLNGDDLHIFHINNAHTDGDAVVQFRKANVVHTGDLYFAGIYPFIDIESGGSIDGMIDAVTILLPLLDENTKVIPGHGPLSNKAELIAFLEMLKNVRGSVLQLVQEGKSLEEVVAAKPTADLDETWGKGFLTPEQFVSIVYYDLSQE